MAYGFLGAKTSFQTIAKLFSGGRNIKWGWIFLLVFFCPLPVFAQDQEVLQAFKEQRGRYERFKKAFEDFSPLSEDGRIYFSAKAAGQIFEQYFRKENHLFSSSFSRDGKKIIARANFAHLSDLAWQKGREASFHFHFDLRFLPEGEKQRFTLSGYFRIESILSRGISNCLDLKVQVKENIFSFPAQGFYSEEVQKQGRELLAQMASSLHGKTFVVGPLLKDIPLRVSRNKTVRLPLQIDFIGMEKGYAVFFAKIPGSTPMAVSFPPLISPQDRDDPVDAMGENEDILLKIQNMVEEAKKEREKILQAGKDLVLEFKSSVVSGFAHHLLPHTSLLDFQEAKGDISLFSAGRVKVEKTGIIVEARGGFQFSHLSSERFPILAPVFPSFQNKKVELSLEVEVKPAILKKGVMELNLKVKILNIKLSERESITSTILGKTLSEAFNLFFQQKLSRFEIPRLRFYAPLFENTSPLILEPVEMVLGQNRAYALMETSSYSPRKRTRR